MLVIYSCERAINHDSFIKKYKLDNYDTIYIVSNFSCGGCVKDYFLDKTINGNSILVFDDGSQNEYIVSLKERRHISISQSVLDTEFDYFGNILILSRINNSFMTTKYPSYENNE